MTWKARDPENYELWSQGKEYTPALTGDDIKGADAKIDSTETGDDNVVQLSFTTAGAQKFADVTRIRPITPSNRPTAAA